MRKFIGKCLLLEENKEKVLVIGDLHLGYEEALLKNGVSVGRKIYEETEKELKEVVDECSKLDYIVLLGDVKHIFGRNTGQEWGDIGKLLDVLKDRCKEVIVIRGNHDNYLANITGKKGVEVRQVWKWKEYCFVHGDFEFEEMKEKDVNVWVMGHIHPAVTLAEGAKREKYKCFLVGKYNKREVIILPSFFPGVIGSDVIAGHVNTAWEFDFDEFEVYVVEGLNVMDFGKLKNI